MLPLSHTISQAHAHTHSCHTKFILPHLHCTWQPDQQFLKGSDRLFKLARHENTHTQTEWPHSFWVWPQHSGPSMMRWPLQLSCSTNTGKSLKSLADLGGILASNLQILLDDAAFAVDGRGHERKVGLWLKKIPVYVTNQPRRVEKKKLWPIMWLIQLHKCKNMCVCSSRSSDVKCTLHLLFDFRVILHRNC